MPDETASLLTETLILLNILHHKDEQIQVPTAKATCANAMPGRVAQRTSPDMEENREKSYNPQ